jgi:hypothetical protein
MAGACPAATASGTVPDSASESAATPTLTWVSSGSRRRSAPTTVAASTPTAASTIALVGKVSERSLPPTKAGERLQRSGYRPTVVMCD